MFPSDPTTSIESAQINPVMRTFGLVANGVGTTDRAIMSNGMAIGRYPEGAALMHQDIGIPIKEATNGYAANGVNDD